MSGKLRYLNFRMLWELLNEYHVLEWGLTIIGATVFIAGFINGAIAFRNSTISWAVFSCIIGTAGLITFFFAGLELFFKVASTIILSYQNTLALEMAKETRNGNMADVGTMTVSPEENKNLLMAFPAIDHGSTSKQKECIKCINTDPLPPKNQTEKLQENIVAECSIPVHAAGKSSPLFYEHGNCKEKSTEEEIIDNLLANADIDGFSTDSYLKNSNSHLGCEKISPDEEFSLSLANSSSNKQLKMNPDLRNTKTISKDINIQSLEACKQSSRDVTTENFKEQKASKQFEINVYEEMQSKDSVLCLGENGNILKKNRKGLNNLESKSLAMDMLTLVNIPETKSFKNKPLNIFDTAFSEYSGFYKENYRRTLLALQQQTSSFEGPEVYY